MKNNIIERAEELNKFKTSLPQLEIGETCRLSDVWDQEGNEPVSGYSYLLTDEGEDGNSNMDIWINYVFEIVQQGNTPEETLVKITNIELL